MITRKFGNLTELPHIAMGGRCRTEQEKRSVTADLVIKIGIVEVKDRSTGERVEVPVASAVGRLIETVSRAKAALAPVTTHP